MPFPATTTSTATATSAATAPRQAPSLTRTDVFLASYRTPLVCGTVATHVAHYQYLTRVRRLDPAAAFASGGGGGGGGGANTGGGAAEATATSVAATAKRTRRVLARAGIAWAGIYVAVLSATTLAQAKVQRATAAEKQRGPQREGLDAV